MYKAAATEERGGITRNSLHQPTIYTISTWGTCWRTLAIKNPYLILAILGHSIDHIRTTNLGSFLCDWLRVVVMHLHVR